jgi:predicted MPP superfamily phosphohydrolase
MSLSGTVAAVFLPRLIIIILHYTGKLFRIRRGGHIRWLTGTGIITGLLMFTVLSLSALYGRFNFKVEKVEMRINDLHPDLNGITIVHISDLHLASFYNHRGALEKAMETVNRLNPDLILNTGDFVSYGWREYDTNDTIIAKARSKYGNYAVMGNHDFGTYHPFYTEADRNDGVLLMNKYVMASGYTVLNDTNTIVQIGNARLGLIGIITMGRFPRVVHGNLTKALEGLGDVDLKILLSHDPNQWTEDVVGKTDIDITLSGHTHGMQMGIYTRNFRWSPAKYFYPHWNGLYSEGRQLHYVNRGLGVLGMPFRIWMPPEITFITLRGE